MRISSSGKFLYPKSGKNGYSDPYILRQMRPSGSREFRLGNTTIHSLLDSISILISVRT